MINEATKLNAEEGMDGQVSTVHCPQIKFKELAVYCISFRICCKFNVIINISFGMCCKYDVIINILFRTVF